MSETAYQVVVEYDENATWPWVASVYRPGLPRPIKTFGEDSEKAVKRRAERWIRNDQTRRIYKYEVPCDER